MRIDPADVLLRLEPGAHLINRKTGKVRSVPAVELHWKDGHRWQRKTFLSSTDDGTLGSILSEIGQWLDSCESLEAALASQAA